MCGSSWVVLSPEWPFIHGSIKHACLVCLVAVSREELARWNALLVQRAGRFGLLSCIWDAGSFQKKRLSLACLFDVHTYIVGSRQSQKHRSIVLFSLSDKFSAIDMLPSSDAPALGMLL